MLAGLTSYAQDCPASFTGTKTLYPPPSQDIASPPTGYQPVFINHAGRHGARHLTKDVSSLFIYTILQRADSLALLTPQGQRLRKMTGALEKIEKTTNKSISFRGMEEQRQLAERMAAHFPGLVHAGNIEKVMITKEKRTLQSAQAFLKGLPMPGEVAMEVNDTILRFYDMAPAYLAFEEQGSWIKMTGQLKKKLKYEQTVNEIVRQFFLPAYRFDNSSAAAQFVSDLFGFVVIIPSIKKEIAEAGYAPADLDFNSFFTCRQLSTLGKIDDAEDFLLKGPGINKNGIQVKIALPLLADFIRTTDHFIETGKRPVELRFTHAEAIAPLAAILGIASDAIKENNISSFEKHWNAGAVIPLSANIQWVLYRHDKDYLVTILLNEKPARIAGMSTNNYPYYHWNELRAFYLGRLQEYGWHEEDNYYKYLQQLH